MSIENERLPHKLGWARKSEVVKLQDILKISDMLANATSLLTQPGASLSAAGVHAGSVKL